MPALLCLIFVMKNTEEVTRTLKMLLS